MKTQKAYSVKKLCKKYLNVTSHRRSRMKTQKKKNRWNVYLQIHETRITPNLPVIVNFD